MGIAPNLHAEFTASLHRAHAALRAGRAATAEAWLRTLEARCPGEVNCLWLLGVALLDQEKIADAIATLERALAAASDFANARVDLARAYRRDGRAAQAREEVRRVLQVTPHHQRAWLAYGDALVDLGQYEDARVAFERARLTDPQRTRIEAATSAARRRSCFGKSCGRIRVMSQHSAVWRRCPLPLIARTTPSGCSSMLSSNRPTSRSLIAGSPRRSYSWDGSRRRRPRRAISRRSNPEAHRPG